MSSTFCIIYYSGETILIGNAEIDHMYDPPHLGKCLRNNIITKHLKFKSEGSKKDEYAIWKAVKGGYIIDKYTNSNKRVNGNLTDDHIYLSNKGKMRVKYFFQVFSKTVSLYLCLLSNLDGNFCFIIFKFY